MLSLSKESRHQGEITKKYEEAMKLLRETKKLVEHVPELC